METGTIEFRQFLLPWNERAKGASELLRRAGKELAQLGPVTILDLTIQGLPYWHKKNYLQEGLYLTFRNDDLVPDIPPTGDVKLETVPEIGGIKLELSNNGGAYNYAALCEAAAEQIEKRADSAFTALHFDHRLVDDRYQYPFIVLMFAPAAKESRA